MKFDEAEMALIKSLRAALPWNWAELRLKLEFDDGSFSPSGSVSRMLGSALDFSDLNMPAEFSHAAFALRKASLNSQAGPVLNMDLALKRSATPVISYLREDQNVTSITQVPRDIHGRLPMFMFKRALPASLLKELRPQEVIYAIQTYVSANPEKQIQNRLREILAIREWVACVCRGGSDSYFFDGPHRDEAEAVKAMNAVRSGLESLGEGDLALAFDQSLAVYAPEVPPALQLCKEIKLTPSSKKPSDNDEEVNRLTRLIQEQDLLWLERTGKHIQENVLEYAST
ncbi:hypothetical protein [Ideonella sp.]|uniref:hypothetical protein n=1 Tax=Ideonella sp. TaxID=1929293 RepID=UPI0037BE8946